MPTPHTSQLNILALLWTVLGLITMAVLLQAFTGIAQNQVRAAKAAERHKAELASRVTDCMLNSTWELRHSCKAMGAAEVTTVSHRQSGFDPLAVHTASLK